MAALLLAGQMLVFLPHMIWPENFVPSDALQPVALAWSLISFSAVVAVIWPSGTVELKAALSERHYKKAGSAFLLLVVGPVFFGFCMGLWFIAGPVSYHLHRMSNSAILSTTTHRVQYADDFGPRSCMKRAVLVGDRFLWPRRVCNLTSSDIEALRKGGGISVFGTVSNFGVLVKESAVEDVDANALQKNGLTGCSTGRLPAALAAAC
jgi:hypothetical protein